MLMMIDDYHSHLDITPVSTASGSELVSVRLSPSTTFNLMHDTNKLKNKYAATFLIGLENWLKNVAAYLFSNLSV